MNISAESNSYCFTAQQGSFLGNDNAIVFTDEDMEVPYPDHRRPLYLEGQINDVFIRRALVDTGSSVNILPLSVLTAAGIPLSKIVQSQTSISGFGNKSEVTVGHVQVNLKVGPIRSLTKFYVVDVDAEFYTECTGAGSNPSKDFGTYLPSWIEIRDLSNEELITIVDRERKRHSEVNNHAYDHPQCSKVTLPDGPPRHMQDGSTAVAEQLETIDLSEDSFAPRPISVSVHLTSEEKVALISLLKEFRDVFAWSYEEMPGLNPSLVSLLSFMGGFSGYNQIKMSPKDAVKTAFRTSYGNFYYTVMPFGLKNAGATYQRAMTAVFHDMMGKEVEDYVDDLVVKSKTREGHWEVLRKVLERCRMYGLKMNPKKCAFGVSSGKFLGFQVHKRGIDVDPEKTRAINSLAPPRSPKELKSFMGRLSYIRRFIPGLAATMSTFTSLLKKGKSYQWSEKCQEAYKRVQQIITKLPTMRAPIPGLPLKLYLAATSTAVGALLAQDDHSGEESPIYYVSRQLRGAEMRYSKTELLCLALVYAAQRLRHYFLAHKLHLIVKSDPVRYLLTRPVLSGRLARWLLQLSEFDITRTTPKAIKEQAVIDMLALFPEVEESTISKEVLGELPEMVAVVTEAKPWTLYFDGSSTLKGGGAGPALVPYCTAAERLVRSFKQVVLEHIPGVTNRYADALATLGSKLSFVEEQPNIAVIKKDMPVVEAMAQEEQLEEDDWRKPVKEKIGK
ncbi:unnamed protein product [Prunus brigantina]